MGAAGRDGTRRDATAPNGREAEVDPDVIERASAGDGRAFAVLVRHYDRRLRALAFRLLGDRDLMDDVLQEAYVKAFRALPSFRSRSGLGTWLYRITYNACVDELRRRPPPTASPDARDAPTVEGPEADVGDRLVIAAALARLPADQRAAVLLVDAEGLDYARAAEVLGVAEGTVASRLSRARVTLRRALDQSVLPGASA